MIDESAYQATEKEKKVQELFLKRQKNEKKINLDEVLAFIGPQG